MSSFSKEDVKWTSVIRDSMGTEVELQDEQGKAVLYTLKAEFQLGGQGYAVLGQPNGEDEVFRIVVSSDGEVELADIEDDEEWEDVSELYDELTFPEE
ncbi:DUF1292 domain-containing protein [Paenibacillus sp. JX-17]|uniref:DUF1292 domain-containing protein n=1 Tax=Paenibacillus lacisoli TaxID=3064525 RepID=A0ABT9CFR1_9BACL|nr:DUF1292 domain-containing protein [Paenibacillus sp. JX-17]MDO7908119.1 DUF1292 domain-containing protein [Paenibacillus sp. JX-17]